MKIVLLMLTITMLSGCASIGKWFADDPIESIPVVEKFTLVHPPVTTPISTKEVSFGVISKKLFIETLMKPPYSFTFNVSEQIANEVFGNDISFFTLNAKNYSNLGSNMQEIIRHVSSQKEAVQYYKDNVPEPTKSDTTSTDG